MSDLEFPIFISESHVEPFYGFSFHLPSKDIGRDDVLIFVEYTHPFADEVNYCVWGQIVASSSRVLLCRASVTDRGKMDLIARIMFELNSNKEFYKKVSAFLDQHG